MNVANLALAVTSSPVVRATSELERLARTSRSTEVATAHMGASSSRVFRQMEMDAVRSTSRINQALAATSTMVGAFTRSMAFGLTTSLAGGFGFSNIIRLSADFERLRASLRTVTGSAEAAGSAFAMLQQFAATTPFSLQQSTEAFIRLQALGLDPTRESLIAYGNTASAMGKELIQFAEAVADATNFEMERLREFGVVAQQAGDEVAFTFQGVTTVVGRNAAEIERYLRRLGEVQFAGAMEEQSRGLNGALSNLGDAAANAADAIGRGGLAEAIADIARDMADATAATESWATALGDLLGTTMSRDWEDLKGILAMLQWIQDNTPGAIAGRAADAWRFGRVDHMDFSPSDGALDGWTPRGNRPYRTIPGTSGIGSDRHFPTTLTFGSEDIPMPGIAPHRDLTSDYGLSAIEEATRAADEQASAIQEVIAALPGEQQQLPRTADRQEVAA